MSLEIHAWGEVDYEKGGGSAQNCMGGACKSSEGSWDKVLESWSTCKVLLLKKAHLKFAIDI